MITSYVRMGLWKLALSLYFKMIGCGVVPNESTFPGLVKACVALKNFRGVRFFHDTILSLGMGSDAGVASSLIKAYSECGQIDVAVDLFEKVRKKDCVIWNEMLNGYAKCGDLDSVLKGFCAMRIAQIRPNSFTFRRILSVCGSKSLIDLGVQLHGQVVVSGLDFEGSINNSLLSMYSKCGQFADASMLFRLMSRADPVTWNCMISGYVQSGLMEESLLLFREMISSGVLPDAITLTSLLRSVSRLENLEFCREIHCYIMRHNILQLSTFLTSSLIDAYFKCRGVTMARNMFSQCTSVDDASKLFRRMSRANLVTWSCMISGYVHSGLMEESLLLFREMISSGVLPNAITFSSLLPSVSKFEKLEFCREIHCYVTRHNIPLNIFLTSSLIDAYFKCRGVTMARNMFSQCTSVDINVFTAMISGYMHNGLNMDALEMFRWLIKVKLSPNAITLVSILPVIGGLVALKLGKELHAFIIKKSFDEMCNVGGAVMDMYARCGRMDLAYEIFVRLSEKDIIIWSCMITRCAQSDNPGSALEFFREMGVSGVKFNCVSISAALSACSKLQRECFGKAIHGFMIKHSLAADISGESALVDMYAKCGNLKSAMYVFEMMKEKNIVSWNSIIAAYGNHGRLKDSLSMFDKMVESGLQPNHITFLELISSCSHNGDIDEGVRLFRSMTEDYGIPAKQKHYSSMVDLFGRAGRLKEAFETIKGMPFPPNAVVWGTLLSACRLHGNVDLAKIASSRLMDLDPHSSSCYVMLANAHAQAGQWGRVRKVRRLMKDKGVEKFPGYSWIEII